MPVLSDSTFQAAAEKLPSTPQIFERLAVALRDPEIGIDEISEILRLDAALSARLLRLSNSVAFANAEPATDLTEAIQRVGFREVFRVVGVAMAGQMYIPGLPIYGISGTELWENSLAVALAAENLALAAGEDPRAAYTLGLLRSVGRLILQRLAAVQICAPLSGRKPTSDLVLAWERSTFGLTNQEAAARLVAWWRLPAVFAPPLQHHFVPAADPARSAGAAQLHLACAIAETLGKGLAIEQAAWTVSEPHLAQAGLTPSAYEAAAVATAESLSHLGKLVALAA